MGERTGIEWCDHTLNFWIGCTEVSPACDHCYARERAKRYGWAEWGNHPRHRTAESTRRQVHRWNAAARKAGKRARVFVNSLSDFADTQVPTEWRDEAWQDIRACPYLDFLILTKRPQNFPKILPSNWQRGWPNVWLGTTAENQAEAERRISHLLGVPAAVRFLSCEPLLGLVDLDCVPRPAAWPPVIDDISDGVDPLRHTRGHVHWVICGGESGPGRRPMDLVWARSLRDQCADAGVAFFGKQWDKVRPLPPDLMVREFPHMGQSSLAVV